MKALILNLVVVIIICQTKVSTIAQEKQYIFSGQVTDSHGQPLPLVILRSLNDRSIGAITDSLGHFSITTNNTDSLPVFITHISYRDTTVTLRPQQNLYLQLVEDTLNLTSISIIPQKEMPAEIIGSKTHPFLASKDSTPVRLKIIGTGSGNGIMYKNDSQKKLLTSLSFYIYNPEKTKMTILVFFYKNVHKLKSYKLYPYNILNKLTTRQIKIKVLRSGWYDLPLEEYKLVLEPLENLFVLLTVVKEESENKTTGYEYSPMPIQMTKGKQNKSLYNLTSYSNKFSIYRKQNYISPIVLYFNLLP